MKPKTILYALTTSFVLLCTTSSIAQILTAEINSLETYPVYEMPDYQPALQEVSKIHDIQNLINMLERTNKTSQQSKMNLDLSQKQFDAMTSCNINNLKEYFQNPEQTWENITKEFDTQEQNLSISINAAYPRTTTSGEEIQVEQMSHWTLGRNILIDLYANPEKYGNLKEKTEMPLWKDQEYLYENEVTNFIKNINKYFSRTGRIPGISSQNTYEENEKAFQAFLKEIIQKTQKQIPANLTKLPIPPKALPPVQEINFYFENPEQSKTIYPEWPAPWKEFIQSNYEKYNPNGEMAKTFQGKTLNLKEDIIHQDPALQNNRLNTYQALKKTLEASKKAHDIVVEYENEQIKNIENQLKSIGINTPVNLQDENSLNNIKNALIEQKRQKIEITRATIKQLDAYKVETGDILQYSPEERERKLANMEVASQEYVKTAAQINASELRKDTDYLNAMENDIEGITTLSTINANEIEDLKKQKEAENALLDEAITFQNAERRKRESKKIDELCLNGGI